VSTSRTARFMVEGVGARVIRGPDWKWGKQVSKMIVSGVKIIVCFKIQLLSKEIMYLFLGRGRGTCWNRTKF